MNDELILELATRLDVAGDGDEDEQAIRDLLAALDGQQAGPPPDRRLQRL